MRRLVLTLALTLSTSAFAHDFMYSGEDCSSRNFQWNGAQTYVEQQTIDAGAVATFKASVTHAPLSVVGDSRTGGYTIDVCKAAARESDLAAIRVTMENGELRASGPDNRRWMVSYKIHAPRNANIDVSAQNGPLAIRDVDGTVMARTQNGPLSLSDVTGRVDAATKNGPISVSGSSGDVKVRATNGPLAVNLDGNGWRGSLDAATQNGPLSLQVPRGYNSSVVVESNGRGPVQCKAEGCERYRALRDNDIAFGSDAPRTIELGRGPANVHIATVNGPITIKDF